MCQLNERNKTESTHGAVLTVPAGFVYELPAGITFMGTAYSEPTLIRLAYAFEQATKARKAPRYLPTLALD